MASKKTPEVNAGSMADIAFLLLIFFLVATTMDVDTGLLRKLPPMPPDEHMKPPDINKRNVLEVLINVNDLILVESQEVQVSEVREIAKEFILNPNDDVGLPVKTEVDVPLLGLMMITEKHVISFGNDRDTSYDVYMQVQNELIAAYNELRDELGEKEFGKPFDELEGDEKSAVQTVFPLHLSETEPKSYAK